MQDQAEKISTMYVIDIILSVRHEQRPALGNKAAAVRPRHRYPTGDERSTGDSSDVKDDHKARA